MKFKLISEPVSQFTTEQQIFSNRGFGLDKIKSYLDANVSCTLHPSLLENIEEGINLLLKHIKRGSHIFLQVDSDADGYTSSSLFLNYLDKLFGLENLNLTYRLQDGKEHGVILNTIFDDEGNCPYDLVILIDAGSNQYLEHKALSDAGCEVLVIDHHDCEEFSEHAIVINNQMSPKYTNKAMCGVGIAYKFCKYLDELTGADYADDYLDLVAVGSIADMMDMREEETHYLTTTGLSNIKNPLLKSLVVKQEYSLRGQVTRIGVAFYIAPLINATIRVGTAAEKDIMFKAMLERDAYAIVDSTKRGCKGQKEQLIEQATRNCTNVHARQKRSREAGALSVHNYIAQHDINLNKVMLVVVDSALEKNLIGLVANQLMAEYKRPVLLVREYEIDGKTVLQGSGRGYDRSELKDLKQFLTDSEMFNFAEGHASAFGLSIDKDKADDFVKYANTELANFSFDSSYEVDYLFKGHDIDNDKIFEIGKMKSLWGKGMEEPYVAIQGLVLAPNRVQLLSPTSKPTLKITLDGGLTIMKFFSSTNEYQEFTKEPNGAIILDIVGKCSINEWNGRQTPQIFIEEYEITSTIPYLF